MLHDYRIRFFDNNNHQKGTFVSISALDLEQAFEFASLIVERLKKDDNWDSNSVAFQ